MLLLLLLINDDARYAGNLSILIVSWLCTQHQ